MLGHIFYFFGLVIFILNVGILSKYFSYLKVKEWASKFNKVAKRQPIKSDFTEKDFEKFLSFNGVVVFTMFWLFFGVLTKIGRAHV